MEKLYIDTAEKLQDFCQRLAGVDWIALDTEFMRERTYYPQLCLIQIATPEMAACIDPLACQDLGPLMEIFYSESVIKVVHSGGQDMEIFYHLQGNVPTPLFDTQIAAPLLGYPEQAGYARLVESITGKHLDKAHTRADWSHRPLTEAQKTYALDDVIYLCEIYIFLRDKLTERGRLLWLDADFSSLSDISRYENSPAKAWRRLKSIYKLRGNKVVVAQELAQWREQTAQSENKPRGWLLKDDVLFDIARQQPNNMNELSRVRGLHEKIAKRYGKHIIELIHSVKNNKPQPVPDLVKTLKPDVRQEAIVDLLNAVVHLRAAEQELNPAQLASRKELQKLVMGETGLDILHGWRNKLIGKELCAVIDGKLSISVIDGKLAINA